MSTHRKPLLCRIGIHTSTYGWGGHGIWCNRCAEQVEPPTAYEAMWLESVKAQFADDEKPTP